MSNVLLQMFPSKRLIGEIANEIANKSTIGIRSKEKCKSKSKLFSKYISTFDLFSKRIKSRKRSFCKFIVDEYSLFPI